MVGASATACLGDRFRPAATSKACHWPAVSSSSLEGFDFLIFPFSKPKSLQCKDSGERELAVDVACPLALLLFDQPHLLSPMLGKM